MNLYKDDQYLMKKYVLTKLLKQQIYVTHKVRFFYDLGACRKVRQITPWELV